MNTNEFSITSIGTVHAKHGNFAIEIFNQYRQGLLELDGFSHLHVFWWGHLQDQPENRTITIAEKAYKKGPDQIGVFATRSPARPNPVLVTVVPVIAIDHVKGLLTIPFIDAEDGTPVIDLKGYYGFDRIKTVRVPYWCSHWPEWYEDCATFDWAGEFEDAQ